MITAPLVLDLSAFADRIIVLEANLMTRFDDLAASVLGLTNTVTRAVEILEALRAQLAEGVLTTEQSAQLDAAIASLGGADAALEAEVGPDPAPEP